MDRSHTVFNCDLKVNFESQGEKCVPFVNPVNMNLPPFNINSEVVEIKKFWNIPVHKIETLNNSDAKRKEWIFIQPQIRSLRADVIARSIPIRMQKHNSIVQMILFMSFSLAQ